MVKAEVVSKECNNLIPATPVRPLYPTLVSERASNHQIPVVVCVPSCSATEPNDDFQKCLC